MFRLSLCWSDGSGTWVSPNLPGMHFDTLKKNFFWTPSFLAFLVFVNCVHWPFSVMLFTNRIWEKMGCILLPTKRLRCIVGWGPPLCQTHKAFCSLMRKLRLRTVKGRPSRSEPRAALSSDWLWQSDLCWCRSLNIQAAEGRGHLGGESLKIAKPLKFPQVNLAPGRYEWFVTSVWSKKKEAFKDPVLSSLFKPTSQGGYKNKLIKVKVNRIVTGLQIFMNILKKLLYYPSKHVIFLSGLNLELTRSY